MNSTIHGAIAQALSDYYGGELPPAPAPRVNIPASSIVRGQTAQALHSLDEPPQSPDVIRVGSYQIEHKGNGDVQEMTVGAAREIPKSSKLDGNITHTQFDRVW